MNRFTRILVLFTILAVTVQSVVNASPIAQFKVQLKSAFNEFMNTEFQQNGKANVYLPKKVSMVCFFTPAFALLTSHIHSIYISYMQKLTQKTLHAATV